MRVEKNVEDRLTVLKPLEEKLDSRLAPQLKEEFVHLNTRGSKHIVLNLVNVKYVDSSGLSAILTGNRMCRTNGGVLVISNVNPHVEKLIKISHLESVLQVLPTEQEAKEAVYMMLLENEITEQENDISN